MTTKKWISALVGVALLTLPLAYSVRKLWQTQALAGLVSQLKSDDVDVRWKAVTNLISMELDAEPAIPTLSELLKNGDANIRAAASRALESLGPEAKSAVPALINLLKDDEWHVRFAAARTLGAIGTEAAPAVPALVELLKEKPRTVSLPYIARRTPWNYLDLGGFFSMSELAVREAAADALGSIGVAARPAVPELMEATKEKDGYLGFLAAMALVHVKPDAKIAMPFFCDMLRAESTRGIALMCLAEMGPEAKETIPFLVELMEKKDTKNDDRRYIAYVLGKIGRDAVSALTKLWKEHHPEAVDGLCEMGLDAKEAIPTLIEMLTDKDYSVRRGASRALGRIGPEATGAVPDLRKMLSDHDSDARIEATRAIGRISNIVNPMLPLLKHETPWIRASTIATLGSMGPNAKEAIPNLVEMLTDQDATCREHAAVALGNVGPEAKTAIPNLVKLLKDMELPAYYGSKYVSAAAATALGNIGPEAKLAVPALKELLKNKHRQVRYAAAEALKQIETK